MKTRPVIFIIKHLSELQKYGKTDKDIYKALQEEEFTNKLKAAYPNRYINAKEEFKKLIREINTYNTFLMENTELICIYGEDASLFYSYQCQTCGAIIVDDHGSDTCIDYDLMCPVCNKVEDKTPFVFHKHGTVRWIHQMRWAEIVHKDEDEDSYISGSVKYCKFRTTWYMRWILKRDYYIRKIKEFFKREK